MKKISTFLMSALAAATMSATDYVLDLSTPAYPEQINYVSNGNAQVWSETYNEEEYILEFPPYIFNHLESGSSWGGSYWDGFTLVKCSDNGTQSDWITNQWGNMAELCRESPLPIALDEELIGINMPEMKANVLNIIKPTYIVLKPSLHGGMHGVREWVEIANEQGIGSWITSALESNVGLNAIAQLAADIYGTDNTMAQGLGTGQLFTDNIPMNLEIRGEKLWKVEK